MLVPPSGCRRTSFISAGNLNLRFEKDFIFLFYVQNDRPWNRETPNVLFPPFLRKKRSTFRISYSTKIGLKPTPIYHTGLYSNLDIFCFSLRGKPLALSLRVFLSNWRENIMQPLRSAPLGLEKRIVLGVTGAGKINCAWYFFPKKRKSGCGSWIGVEAHLSFRFQSQRWSPPSLDGVGGGWHWKTTKKGGEEEAIAASGWHSPCI